MSNSNGKGVNFNTIVCQTPGLPCPCTLNSNCRYINTNPYLLYLINAPLFLRAQTFSLVRR